MSLITIMQATGPSRAAEPRDSGEDLTTVTRSVESGQGRISVTYSLPKARTPSQCLFIAHGVKDSMNSSLVRYFHTALAAHGFLTVKFNFPYAEGSLRFLRKPDPKDVLVNCYRKVVDDALRSRWKPRSLFLGGVSLGAAVASHVVSDGPSISEVKGLFFLSYPLHRPGSPSMLGDKHLHKITKPMLFVSGTRDIYAEPSALRATSSSLGANAETFWVEGANHTFDKNKGRAIYFKTLYEIVEKITSWVQSQNASRDT